MGIPLTLRFTAVISDNGRFQMPTLVPAKRFVPETKRAKTAVFGKVKPASTVVQLAPLLVDRDTRLPKPVPAKILVPETAKDRDRSAQAGIDINPTCAIIRGEEDVICSPSKDIRSFNCKRTDIFVRKACIDRSPT